MANKREDERLDKPNLLKVIALLEQEKPITKKAACEMLNISYNTTRLKKLIDQFKVNEENNKKRRAKLRGKPITDEERSIIASEYLNNIAISAISDFIYRPATLIKSTIEELLIPLRHADASYQNPYVIDENAITEDYMEDDLVYSARYQCAALIDTEIHSPEGKVYRIFLLGKEQQYAYQPYWELADLTRVQKELGVQIKPHTGLQPSYNPPNLRKV